ncbi:hypothetical protein [Aureimonas sp. AU20]|uniref:hypothetical protein n=1 Tax=Aureimonas sp. AU20 TaxID=1349819 RepID=UPI0007206A4C|nr:hypothetical protein [Aureimonas sp. AU20]ALN75829.1 hypothetical protein M673_24050 [Aureimonas sp. AU20]
MTGGGRRTQRWPTIFDAHRADLMRSAYQLWSDCVPAMISLRTDSQDYYAVVRLQASTISFSKEISGGQSWVSVGSTTPASYQPSWQAGRDGEIDAIVSECGGDERRAIRTLLDAVKRLEHDQERLMAFHV